jgi:hypothetical protein
MGAHLRAARACLHLRRPHDALGLYREALSISPGCAAAKVRREQAKRVVSLG